MKTAITRNIKRKVSYSKDIKLLMKRNRYFNFYSFKVRVFMSKCSVHIDSNGFAVNKEFD